MSSPESDCRYQETAQAGRPSLDLETTAPEAGSRLSSTRSPSPKVPAAETVESCPCVSQGDAQAMLRYRSSIWFQLLVDRSRIQTSLRDRVCSGFFDAGRGIQSLTGVQSCVASTAKNLPSGLGATNWIFAVELNGVVA